jgi:hypothetical protein
MGELGLSVVPVGNDHGNLSSSTDTIHFVFSVWQTADRTWRPGIRGVQVALSHRQPVVAVFGSSTLAETDPQFREVVSLGAELARAGFAVMTGGYGGAMAAASRGAHEAGGHVIGVTVDLFEARGPVNPWVRERVHTPDIFARLKHLVHEADAFVAVSGSIGTLTELFLSWTMLSVRARPEAPLVLMGAHWREWLAAHRSPELVPGHLFGFVEVADTPQLTARAVAEAIAKAKQARAGQALREVER